MVAEVLQSVPLNVSLRRALVGINLIEWHSLVTNIMHVTLNKMLDMFVWGLHKNGSFSVNSINKLLISNCMKVTQEICKMKIPLKTKYSCGSSKKDCFNKKYSSRKEFKW